MKCPHCEAEIKKAHVFFEVRHVVEINDDMTPGATLETGEPYLNEGHTQIECPECGESLDKELIATFGVLSAE
jgi:uncharacterized protein (UPF0212 family)